MYEKREQLMTHKKARLIEEHMNYEDLAVSQNFDEDEVTFALNRQLLKDRKSKAALLKAKKLEKQLSELKKISLNGMQAIVETIHAIDDNSKKIFFQPFDQKEVNILEREVPGIISGLR